jgi:heme exporter protein C
MNRAIPILAALAAIGFAITIYAIFNYAPFEPSLLFNQKIFYYHVPHAFMLFAAVTVCGVASLIFLKNRKPYWDDLALAGAEVAVMFGAAVLVTGSIWAEAAWDKWWVWEKRLTMSLLLWLVRLRIGSPPASRCSARSASRSSTRWSTRAIITRKPVATAT